MATKSIRIPITNVLAEGDYTGAIYIGSKKTVVNVLLDTGSSTLSLDGHYYDFTKDKDAQITNIAQEVGYGDGSTWMGGVVLTDVTMGSGKNAITLAKVNTAVAYHATANMFGKTNGILGLAYKNLNNAFTLPGPTLPPKYTYNQIEAGRIAYIEPYFSQLEETGIIANKFAFYTLRSMVHMKMKDPSKDPLNNGFLIVGSGEECKDLYTGTFQNVKVLHDEYYNTNIKAIIVGDSDPIEVSPPTKNSGDASNSIVDSGTNGIYLHKDLFKAIEQHLSKSDNDDLVHAIRSGYIKMSDLNLEDWPVITFVMEGDNGKDAKLDVTPDTYWQLNAPEPGRASLAIYSDTDTQAILGLPLMNNYYTIHDRSVDKGMGVIKFAKIKK